MDVHHQNSYQIILSKGKIVFFFQKKNQEKDIHCTVYSFYIFQLTEFSKKIVFKPAVLHLYFDKF